jgi:hypothetical protein
LVAAIWRNLLGICAFAQPLNALFSAPGDSLTTISLSILHQFIAANFGVQVKN